MTAAGLSALHLAASYRKRGAARLLLDAKVNVDARDIDGVTPLMVAAGRGDLKMCKLLLEKGGAYIGQRDNEGNTALCYAAFRGGIKLLR